MLATPRRAPKKGIGMYFCHGWFQLSSDTYESEDEEALGGVEAIRVHLAKYGISDTLPRRRPWSRTKRSEPLGKLVDATFSNMLGQVFWQNGTAILTITASKNRPLHLPEMLDGLLDLLATTLPGSFGLVYESDDEREKEPGPNAFRVRKLARGRVTEVDDHLLSPMDPTIWDN